MMKYGGGIKIFSGNSNRSIAKKIASFLQVPLGNAEVKTFSDGEISVSINEPVRGANCFVVQSTCPPVNDNLMELLIMIDAMKRASAANITAVIPYFGYARQDRKSHTGDPISAKLVADLLTAAGATRVLTMDLHSPQIQGFFDIPIDNLFGLTAFEPLIKDKIKSNNQNYVVVSPDIGSSARAKTFSSKLGVSLAIVDKSRQYPNISKAVNVIGDVKGKHVILVDDIVDTSGTLCHAAKAVIENGGAIDVIACVTHTILSGQALKNIQDSYISKIYTLDTIPIAKDGLLDKFAAASGASLFAEAINALKGEK
ncbi:MAG: ribose-phosphate pyrophosphokinase [Clostridia bacterium]|nr:ribose-phosphate pyrophosphokinase [Clostridia bacterium]